MTTDESERTSDVAFRIRVSVANTIGFLLGTISAIVVDPLLIHHARYGVRTYAIGWWVLPIGIAVGLATYFILTWSKRQYRVRVACAPFFLVSLLMLPFFRPEFPHGSILSATVLVGAITTIAVWIRYQPIKSDYPGDTKIDHSARLEHIKQEILFWRSMMTVFTGGLAVALISWFAIVFEANRMVDVERAELFVLNSQGGTVVVFAALWVLFGPVAEMTQKCRDARDLLLKMPAEKPAGPAGMN